MKPSNETSAPRIGKKVEQNQGFGYGGHSDWTKQCHNKKACDNEEEDKNL